MVNMILLKICFWHGSAIRFLALILIISISAAQNRSVLPQLMLQLLLDE